MTEINVIGAGLAGCEAAYQIAKRGIKVNLFEMKPVKFSPAHNNPDFCELVCSNSLKNENPLTSSGMLKEEMKLFDSLVLRCANMSRVPAGSALAVDRTLFSSLVTKELKKNKNVNIVNQEFLKIDENKINVIATGPLTDGLFADEIKKITGKDNLYFFDAAAPIVSFESIDYDKTFFMSRYNKGDADYLNCPLNKEEYRLFYNELINAESIKLKDFENDKVFEGCMPIEVMARRGIDTIRYGPLKPAGLYDEKNDTKPYAVLQLRRENLVGDYYNLVGFQTNLTYSEQKRVFSLIPALKNAEFVKYGVMHRNTFVNAPQCLNKYSALKNNGNIFIAGQLSGVEGYLESCVSGLICGINAANKALAKEPLELDSETMTGALLDYISNTSNKNFQPVNSNYAILAPLLKDVKDKDLKRKMYLDRAIDKIKKCQIFEKI